MKNLMLLLICLFSIQFSFAQSTHESKTSITVSDGDDNFSITAHFSRSIPKSIKAEIQTNLGKANKQTKKLVWEKEVDGNLAYVFKVGKKDCSIFLDKNLLSQNEYDDLFDLSASVLDLLEEDKTHNTPAAPTPPKPPKTKKKEGTKIKLHFDGDIGKRSSSISITDEEEEYSLSARFDSELSKTIKSKIEKALDHPGIKKSSNKYVWKKELKGERAYRISISKKACKIFINKELVKGRAYQDLVNLATDIANYIKHD